MSMLESNETARQSDHSDCSQTSDSQAASHNLISLSNSYKSTSPSMFHISAKEIIDSDLLQSLKEILAAGNNPIIDAEVGHLADVSRYNAMGGLE